MGKRMNTVPAVPLRRPILLTLSGCLLVALAPWFTGGQEPIALLISGGALLLAALLAVAQPQVRRLRMGPLVATYGVLIGWATLSLVWTANSYSSWVWIVQWVLAGLAFKLAYTLAGEPGGRRLIVRGYLVSAAIFCLVALWIYLTGEYDRLTGSFWWANPAAAYLMPAILLALDFLRRAEGRAVWLWFAATVGFGSAFWLTDSRLGTLTLGAVLIIYLLVVKTNKTFWIRFLFTILTTLAVSTSLAFLSQITAQRDNNVPGSRFAEAVQGEAKSGSDRFNYLSSAFEMWLDRPVTGVGAGAYADVHPGYQPNVTSAGTNAHNLYVQVLAELGIIGGIALFALLMWLLLGVMRGLSQSPAGIPLALGALALGVHFGLDIDAGYPALLMLAAVLLGLVYRQWVMRRARAGWWWPVAAAAIMLPVVSVYQSGVWANGGSVAQADGDFELAVERYEQARSSLVYDPDYLNAEGINLYALAFFGAQGADVRALELARQAQGRDRYDAQHYQLEGRILAQQGQLPGANRAFTRALELDPLNHPDYALDLASIQTRQDELDAAVKTARMMLALYPKPVVDNRNFDETLRPTLANLEALVGNIQLTRGELAAAGESARRAIDLDPKSLRGRALLVQVDLRRSAGQPDMPAAGSGPQTDGAAPGPAPALQLQ